MKIVHIETLISRGVFPNSREWKRIRKHLHHAIKAVDWPVGSGRFTIFPESGKKRGKGNGVTPIKRELIAELERYGWKREERLDLASAQHAGKLVVIEHDATSTRVPRIPKGTDGRARN